MLFFILNKPSLHEYIRLSVVHNILFDFFLWLFIEPVDLRIRWTKFNTLAFAVLILLARISIIGKWQFVDTSDDVYCRTCSGMSAKWVLYFFVVSLVSVGQITAGYRM